MVSKEQAISAAKLIDSLYYYTPSIEDIHVGYECELYLNKQGYAQYPSEWKSIKIAQEAYHSTSPYGGDLSELDEVCNLIGIGQVRTPYLTKEQIEKEGWVKIDNKFNDTQRIVHIPDYELKTDFGSLRLYIPNLRKVYEDIVIEKYTKGNPNDVWSMSSLSIIYRGPCPSINEFRKIVKLLGIVK